MGKVLHFPLFYVPLHRVRDNRGRGPALTVAQGMHFCTNLLLLLDCNGWEIFL